MLSILRHHNIIIYITLTNIVIFKLHFYLVWQPTIKFEYVIILNMNKFHIYYIY